MILKFFDGRTLVGTQLQILRQMRQLDYDTAGTLAAYVERLRERAAMLGYSIAPKGANDQELAENTVAEMLRVGLLERGNG